MNKIKFKGKTLYRKRCINNILAVYNDAARLVGLLPLELQAITWVQWRKYEIR